MDLSEKLKTKNFVPKILTFGSCLSRYTADRYSNMYGAWTVSSVYHNRSDQFCEYFIDKKPEPDWGELTKSVLQEMTVNDKVGDEDPVQIIRNQTVDTMGLHNIREGLPVGLVKSGVPLDVILEQQDVDIVLMDNHMDLGAKLWYEKNGSKPFFMRSDYGPNFTDHYTLGPYLTADESAAYNNKIAAYLKTKLPRAKIIFLHFPISTKAQERRINMTLEFVDALNSDLMNLSLIHI